jgi:RND family efflux transporter MFP subunit
MTHRRLLWVALLVVVLLVASGGYYYYRNIYSQAQVPVEEEAIATSTVTRGDLVITATGSGTLVPAAEISLAFGSSGVLTELLVQVGDSVKAGQVLARLDDADARDAVTEAEISLRQAELTLADLTQEVDRSELASAQASLSSAKAELTALTAAPSNDEVLAARQTLKSAQDALADLLDGPDPEEVAIAKADMVSAEMAVRTAQAAYDKIAWRDGSGATQEAADLWTATNAYERAQAEYEEAKKGATDSEIADARAQVALAQAQLNALWKAPDPDELAAAQAKVTQAEAALEALTSGATASELEAAELARAQAELSLRSAQRSLTGSVLRAPMDGTVIAVDAQVGEQVGSSAIITLADLSQPRVQFWVEEADLTSIAVGNPVSIVFEALPDYSFPGEILSVDPVLVEVDSTPAVQSYASIDLATHPVKLLSGMNAEVEVVAGEARNAVLVPIEALRELGPDQYAVLIVQADGEQELRVVQVGLKDYVNAEILSGLAEGEVVSLGTESSSQTTTTSPTDQGPQPFMVPFPGG